MPALQVLGWRSLIDSEFGPRLVKSVGTCDLQVADSPRGEFSLDFGIDIDGVRTVLALRSEYGEPKKALTDPAKYYDPTWYDQALR